MQYAGQKPKPEKQGGLQGAFRRLSRACRRARQGLVLQAYQSDRKVWVGELRPAEQVASTQTARA